MALFSRNYRLATRTATRLNSFIFRSSSTVQNTQKLNYFDLGVKVIPHPQKVHKGGEDATFTHKNCLAVADGVGGWANYGIDPALYSKKLCKNMEDLVKRDWNTYKISPEKLIVDAAGKVREQGSCTVCVANLDEEKPVLHTAFIGDSAYMLLRKEGTFLRMIIHSTEQQKSFNFPYQIGTNGDPPELSVVAQHAVQHNDIVVVGTDGLFDNLDDLQIIHTIKPFTDSGHDIDPVLIAEMIAELAYKYSLDMKHMSPFAIKANKAYLDFRGGKSDDITVVVGQVKILVRPKDYTL